MQKYIMTAPPKGKSYFFIGITQYTLDKIRGRSKKDAEWLDDNPGFSPGCISWILRADFKDSGLVKLEGGDIPVRIQLGDIDHFNEFRVLTEQELSDKGYWMFSSQCPDVYSGYSESMREAIREEILGNWLIDLYEVRQPLKNLLCDDYVTINYEVLSTGRHLTITIPTRYLVNDLDSHLTAFQRDNSKSGKSEKPLRRESPSCENKTELLYLSEPKNETELIIISKTEKSWKS